MKMLPTHIAGIQLCKAPVKREAAASRGLSLVERKIRTHMSDYAGRFGLQALAAFPVKDICNVAF